MTPLTQGAITVLLNLLQEVQGQTRAAKVCADAQSAYLPLPETLPFETDICMTP